MDIGIIGAGNIGSTLARRLAKAGHAVRIANSRGPETLARLAEATGAQAVSLRDVARGVAIVAGELTGWLQQLPQPQSV